MKRLAIDANKQCVGCRQCELACSIVHEGCFAPWLARVNVDRKEDIVLSSPVICRHCSDAPCAAACPVDAIIKSEATGAYYVDNRLCIGCLQCIEACPYGAVFFNNSKGIALKCDMCGGDPACVRACPNGVIVEEAGGHV
jgi:Fe-S-cluster-containing hydrogenase component 2